MLFVPVVDSNQKPLMPTTDTELKADLQALMAVGWLYRIGDRYTPCKSEAQTRRDWLQELVREGITPVRAKRIVKGLDEFGHRMRTA